MSANIKIIYGVSGEGSGHAIRSREVIRYLINEGHEVQVVTYDRGKDLLGEEFSVTEVFGLHFDYQHNAIRYLSTIWRNLIRAPEAVKSLELAANLFQTTRPDVVCTDFEPVTALTALRFGVPIISIGNIHHVLFRGSRVPWRYRHDWLVSKAVVRLIVPRADHYVVTTLASEPVKKSHVHIVPPIIRPSILGARPHRGEHILVYDSFKNERLPVILQKTNQLYRIYGHGAIGRQGNLDFRAFSEQGFLDDLLGCRAIIGTGGFTLISESLVLKKPYLAIPIAGQFEQIDNALELERLGYGKMLRVAEIDGIAEFLRNLDVFEERLEAYHHPGNDSAMALIESLVDELAGVKVIH
ncbi:hypothetical protein A3H10_01230 [Candidatus Uhrbacteria bacterium RIFCSPLOWO2_12_FULL_46_10]|uniref:Glycosyl transferase family 28 C-terminal domain-containing protein n=1 Tax=Candidatus Uhrbacteria bacterium RIFCSPLOWO2_01_FULL_47_25 TaxID=1802402 RepID=A0A1F7UPP3_9BACT|nr:MAG: Teichoic acid biosynthesis related protein [Parcubacteria group bacterium GW2011_GWA2_46_9]OGL59212.1 MAG: hypothetical protein A2752_01900 [Candidatus Uhrbacteria bacterium RIFCSPHIGHO2_01_FULL_46_23]OGL69156.1 MAG: hypothetical protein A3D60_04625 [Candidatus Uhrbacteria bacterium RIFCSPHIGHO2_02_FULL_47_29]OGL75563.1 MAG: hypothetical protein A3E96_03005 [Candidatus Uhrbacteria bacterium RIFCSPHIGHO2_12_FULL_46_13]OGL80219.1 MAG: hypothetical protein A2936_02530 [Candidatus Uhrbacter